MEIKLTGEDGRSFFALTNQEYQKAIMPTLGISEITQIYVRASFGRRAGSCKGASSGFGESDAVIIGKSDGTAEKYIIVFLEAKEGSIVKRILKEKNNTINQLKYQFALKLALLDCIYSTKETENEQYYEISPNGSDLAKHLNNLYRATKKKDRTVGWKLKNSDSSPCLQRILKLKKKNQIKSFKFLASGFVGPKGKKDESTFDIDGAVFENLANNGVIDKNSGKIEIDVLDWPCEKVCTIIKNNLDQKN